MRRLCAESRQLEESYEKQEKFMEMVDAIWYKPSASTQVPHLR